jgi:FecR protein
VTYRLSLAFALLGCLLLGGHQDLSAMPSPADVNSTAPVTDATQTPLIPLAQAPQAPQTSDPAAAPPAQTPADEPIGNVATLTGTVTVVRNKNSLPLKLRDDVYFNDTVQTSTNSTLGITFNDSTTFNLSANSKITIDNYVYEEGGSQNTASFDIARGTVAFVAAAVAKTGDMKITTPTATLGIRGTTGLVEVPEGATATNANNVAIKLYPDADGRVGRIEVNDRTGARLGALTQGASGFTIRPGTGGVRFAAVPLAIPREQVLRDQGFVRQVHAAQTVGRQIVTEQRAFRRANPPATNRGNQPNQQRPNGAPGQNRPGQPQQGAPNNRQGGTQQPGTPNRQRTQQPGNPQQQGRPGQPGQPARPNQTSPSQTPQQTPQGQPGAPNRQGTQQQPPNGTQPSGQPPRPGQPQRGAGQPGTPPQPGGPQRPGVPQQGAPGLQRPGLQRPQFPGRPALQRARPGAPKGREKKRY